jgi:hypothetical protein
MGSRDAPERPSRKLDVCVGAGNLPAGPIDPLSLSSKIVIVPSGNNYQPTLVPPVPKLLLFRQLSRRADAGQMVVDQQSFLRT